MILATANVILVLLVGFLSVSLLASTDEQSSLHDQLVTMTARYETTKEDYTELLNTVGRQPPTPFNPTGDKGESK
jgi:hypothetical protein